MPFYTLTFDNPPIEFNVSLQVGDTVYYCPVTSVGGVPTANMQDVTMIGELREINITEVTVGGVLVPVNQPNLYCYSALPPTSLPNPGDFIMFSKDNQANLNSLLGYVAEVEFANHTKDKAELFSVGAEVSESSK
jgi:hypothetical protein